MLDTIANLYNDFLRLTNGDTTAASNLVMAHTMQSVQDAKTAPAVTPASVLTVTEAAARLNLCDKKVYEMCRAGELRSVRAGRAIRIPVDEIERFQANLTPVKRPPRLTGFQHF